MATGLRAAEQLPSPWRNGGGNTREVVVYPAGASWNDVGRRISVAEVTSSGAFSSSEGMNRTIVLLEGPTMELSVEGVEHRPTRHMPVAFDGGPPAPAAVPDGPVEGTAVLAVPGDGEVHLDTGDAVVDLDNTCPEGTGLGVGGTGTVAVVLLHPVNPATAPARPPAG